MEAYQVHVPARYGILNTIIRYRVYYSVLLYFVLNLIGTAQDYLSTLRSGRGHSRHQDSGDNTRILNLVYYIDGAANIRSTAIYILNLVVI
jgi:hypothetical protein